MLQLVVKVAFSLLVVLFMLWGLARALRRPFGGRGNGPVTVLTRQPLSRGSSVAVVRVADRAFVLGITDQQINLIGETELDAFEVEPPEHRDHLVVVEPDQLIPATDELPGRHPASEPPLVEEPTFADRLHGESPLSPKHWGDTLDFLRDRTTRR
ncbi:flagellar biosynthetic protein FliO [Actinoplanes sp. NPDC051851]|uniref:FliO/MopB family protein n=1 Tax=Actinoplanes sp. NPDC051851 TaxID=3154753 RepID=UPI0034142087